MNWRQNCQAKRNQNSKIWKVQPIHIGKVCSEENTEGVTEASDKEIMDLGHSLSRRQEYRWDYTGKTLPSGSKGDRKKKQENEGRFVQHRWSSRTALYIAIWLWTCAILSGKGRMILRVIQRWSGCFHRAVPRLGHLLSPGRALGLGLPTQGTGYGFGRCTPPTNGPGGQSIGPKRTILETKEQMEFALLGFGLSWDLSPLITFLFLPVGMEKNILYLSHHLILEVYPFCCLTDSQLERNFAWGWILPPVLLIPD